MCNRVSAPECREIKIRWNLFNDLPEFKRSHNVAPGRGDMLAIVQSPVAELPKGERWLFEIKLDGYRCLAGRDSHGVTLWSRRANLFTRQFPTIAHEGLRVAST